MTKTVIIVTIDTIIFINIHLRKSITKYHSTRFTIRYAEETKYEAIQNSMRHRYIVVQQTNESTI